MPSIDDAMQFYGNKLGLAVHDALELPDRQLKVTFVQAANVLLELLEPTDPDTPVARFLERRGPGLHHLCFGTPDIRAHLRDLKDKGIELIDEAPRPGAHGDVAFLQPSAGLGVLIELLQPLPVEAGPGASEANAVGADAGPSAGPPAGAGPSEHVPSEASPSHGTPGAASPSGGALTDAGPSHGGPAAEGSPGQSASAAAPPSERTPADGSLADGRGAEHGASGGGAGPSAGAGGGGAADAGAGPGGGGLSGEG